MSPTAAQQRYLRVGIILMVAGAAVALAAAYAVHLIGLPETNSFGVELYPNVPRGWVPTLVAQIISLSGLLVLAGALGALHLLSQGLNPGKSGIRSYETLNPQVTISRSDGKVVAEGVMPFG